MALIPKSITDNGKTLTLVDVQWASAESTDGEGGIVTHYTATASYTGSTSSRYATGYTVTADYVGEVAKTDCQVVTYTATFGSVAVPEESQAPAATNEPAEPDHLRRRHTGGHGPVRARRPGGQRRHRQAQQDDAAPLLTRDELEAVRREEPGRPAVTERAITAVTPDTFWILLAQAKAACDGNQRAVYWLTERMLAMGPEQALNFHSIVHGYMELADKYGLWNAAILIHGDGCYADGFEDFRAWLIFQGREAYLAALKDPDSLADVPACAKEMYRFADLPYAGSMAYARLTGRRVHDDIPPADHQQMVAELEKDIVYGAEIGYPHEWSEVAAYLPRLTAQHLTPEELRACICRGHMWYGVNGLQLDLCLPQHIPNHLLALGYLILEIRAVLKQPFRRVHI